MTRPERADKIAALVAQLAELLSEQERPEIPAPRISPEHILLTVEEAAQRLQIGRTQMFALIKSGEVKSVQIGRLRRIHLDELNSYIQVLKGRK